MKRIHYILLALFTFTIGGILLYQGIVYPSIDSLIIILTVLNVLAALTVIGLVVLIMNHDSS